MANLGSRCVRGATVAAMVMVVSRAEATVTQVDGTVVPVTTRMQTAIDAYETPAGSIDAKKDAAEQPQIFLPRLSSPVVFLDIAEGASFENSFGWYHVGDDVSTAAGRALNLHPVMGCGVQMLDPALDNRAGDATHHTGNPAYYKQTTEPGDSISVDFAAERTAGRYRGGYIGFYMITSENNPSSNNCGDFKNGTDSNSLFGFIYFTQKDLNNDGDFVHHLVYRSKTADRFFFGFEDLFRGGDNDFEDMAMRIDGLTPPCVPSAEICDGIDNDCDGKVDNADSDLTGVGSSCTCDDVSMPCDAGPQTGPCLQGVTVCTASGLVCHAGAPTLEVCDGIDNNCNGQVDDAVTDPTLGQSCDGPDADACREGEIACVSGALVCNDSTGANVEYCDGIDNNCDGNIDEGDPEGGASCGSSIGVCTPGVEHCVGAMLVCQGGNRGGDETCNGLDDDCDGVVDDHLTDTGQSCGASNTGECRFGQTICVGGSLQCAGEVGPTPERCNGLDDNCNGPADDNPIDTGQVCGSSIGACRPGTLTCANGGLECTGGVPESDEICDGIDNDCNGVVDDNVAGEGEACGSGGGGGACSGGTTRCIAGTMQCVGGTGGGTEVCNGIDDDCDGMIDNGDLCNGGVCDHGRCASRCLASEFPCPIGQLCNTDGLCVTDACYGVTCPNDADGNLQVCHDGACQALCPTIDCPNHLVCRGSDGACVADTCDYLPKCAADQICVNASCEANPCNGVTCPTGQFCRSGGCVASCDGVRCGAGQTCRDGACVATGCRIDCGDDVCNPDTGTCQRARCSGVTCPGTKMCDPLNGTCVADPCQGVSCPTGQSCSLGQCGLAPKGGLVTTGGGGCSTTSDGSLGVGLVVIALALGLRRRSRRTAGAARAVPAAVIAVCLAGSTTLLGGCKINDYCLACETPGRDAGGDSDADGGSGVVDPATCDPNQIHPESCNGADDNCDGQVDEGFDLQTDPLNCGACGIQCNKPGAQTRCVAGACQIVGCFPGFSDRDGDTSGGYTMSNGCEYLCFQSNSGVEACDGLDNDCNGVVDDGFDKTSDNNNCGACGRVCQFFGATGHCSNSQCQFNPATDCQPGFYDIDGVAANGCEYACTPSNGGVESCDLRDNDCDGLVDEDFNFAGDANNCGRCGLVCQFPHAGASCTLGVCRFDPVNDCQPGFHDANGNQLDGCEYACTPTNGGVEICDGIDNNCNGVADENPIDAGGACASTGTPVGACVANGTLTCAAGHLVCTGAAEPGRETCNNADDDCNGAIDNGVTQACYDGANGTAGVGVCHTGTAACTAGAFGACAGEVVPSAEQCNGLDDDCNGTVDDAPGGGAITASCYTGAVGTDGVGTCKAGTKTCAVGAFGACVGEVVPAAHDVCGDGRDSDCDGKGDAAEGCLALDTEARLDAPGGTLGEATGGTEHSYDLVFARGGVPLGTNIYAAWSQLQTISGATEVYVRKSSDGGQTWGTIVNVTSGISGNKVKPALAVRPGATDRVVVAYQTVASGVRDIRVQISTNGGATFGSQSAALDAAGDSFHHVVAISGSTCVVAWEKLDTTTLNRDIMSRTSSNGCGTFNAETKINVGTGARFAGRPQVGITSGGGIVWAWREQRSNSTRDVYAAAAPSPTGAVTEVAIDTDSGADADFPVLQVNETAAYLVWQNVSTSASGGSDAMFAKSSDSGATWGTPRVIDDPVSEVSSSFTPTLAIDPKAAGNADDLVAIAWEDRRQGSQVFASVSSDGGTTFTTPTRASSETGDAITGGTTVPQLAAAGSGVLAIAYQNQQTQSTARPHVFLATSIDTGATWTYTEFRVDGGVGAAIAPQIIPSLVSSKPAAVVGWTDFRANQLSGDVYIAVSH